MHLVPKAGPVSRSALRESEGCCERTAERSAPGDDPFPVVYAVTVVERLAAGV